MASVIFKPAGSPKTIKYLNVEKDYNSNFKSVDSPKEISFNEVLPFRVRFSSIGIPGVVGLVPPIGIAIIGVNNYIL